MISSSSVVKTTRKARRFAPFRPQLQFQAVGQEHRRSGTVIHYLLSVLKCLGLMIIIQDSKDIVIRFQEVGRAKRLAVISEVLKTSPQHKEKSPRSQFLNNSPHTDTPISRPSELRMHPRLAVAGTSHLPSRSGSAKRKEMFAGQILLQDRSCFSSDPASTCAANYVTETYRASFPAVWWKSCLAQSGWVSGTPPPRRQSLVLPAGWQVPPGSHSAATRAGRTLGEGSRCPEHRGAPRLRHGVPAHTFGPQDPPPAARSTIPAFLRSKSETGEIPATALPRSGRAGPQRSPPPEIRSRGLGGTRRRSESSRESQPTKDSVPRAAFSFFFSPQCV